MLHFLHNIELAFMSTPSYDKKQGLIKICNLKKIINMDNVLCQVFFFVHAQAEQKRRYF